MAYRYDERDSRYGDPFDEGVIIRDPFDVPDLPVNIQQPEQPLDEVTPDQITADKNNYSIPASNLIRLDSDAARTITGFAGARPGIFMIAYVGAFSIILPNENAGSDAQNRMLTHSGASITLTANQIAIMQYDSTSARWRIGEMS